MRRAQLWAGGLAAATVAMRLPRALGSSFWQDEVASARVIREPSFGAMLHQVARTESTPPLWYALAWTTHRAGASIHDVRLLSVAFDAGAVALVVLLAAALLPTGLAAGAGVVAAAGAELSAHGRELRAYELFALLTLALAAALRRAAERPDARRLAPLAAAVAAGLLTHYFFVYSAAACALWVAVEPALAGRRRRLLAALAAGTLPLLPWLPSMLGQVRHDRYSWIGPFRWREVVETQLRLVAPELANRWSAALFLSLLAVGAWTLARRGPLGRLVAALALLPLVLAAATWAAGIHVFAVRNLLGVAPFAAMLTVAPLQLVPRPARVALAGIVAGTAVGAWLWAQTVPTTPFRTIAGALVAEGWRPPDALLVPRDVSAFRSPLEWYLPDAPRLVEKHGRAPLYAVLPAARAARLASTETLHVGRFVVARLLGRATARGPVLVAARPGLSAPAAPATRARAGRRADR